MAGVFRSFVFAPSRASHEADLQRIRALAGRLSTGEVVESAYRRSSGRLNAFFFAQGVVVGAMGNLFASALGHFIDRPANAAAWQDEAWIAVAAVSLGLMLTMGAGAMRRYRQNGEVERLFLAELQRRGGESSDDSLDPDDLVALGRRRLTRP
jgi:hypothetical protein